MACTRQAEAEVVVAVAGIVPVAVRRTAVDGVVVPGAAANNPVGARFPSALDERVYHHPPPQRQGVCMGGMGEQARSGPRQIGKLDPSFPVRTLPRMQLTAEAAQAAPIQADQARIDTEAKKWNPLGNRRQQGGPILELQGHAVPQEVADLRKPEMQGRVVPASVRDPLTTG